METTSSHSNPAIVLLFCQHLPKMCVHAQSCLILCDPQDYSAPGSSLCSWTSPGKNTGVGCHFLLQGIFPTQGSNTHFLYLLHWQTDSLSLHHLEAPLLHTKYMIIQYAHIFYIVIICYFLLMWLLILVSTMLFS